MREWERKLQEGDERLAQNRRHINERERQKSIIERVTNICGCWGIIAV
ncbi:hypothetical protein OROGR_014868 [Orobanche gracilis]